MGDIATKLASKSGYPYFKRVQYVAYNPTFGTAIAINTDPNAIAATEGTLSIYNSASRTSTNAGNNTIIIPQYIKMSCTVVPASGTTLNVRLANDVIKRYSSGGSALTVNETFVDTFSGFARRTAYGQVYFGDLTLAAASSEAQVGQCQFHSATAAGIVGDQYLIKFGDFANPNALLSGSAAQAYTQSVPEVVIGPGCSLIMQVVSASAASTAGTYQVEVGFLEILRGD